MSEAEVLKTFPHSHVISTLLGKDGSPLRLTAFYFFDIKSTFDFHFISDLYFINLYKQAF